MNAAAAVAHILKAEGTEYLFCFPANALIDECARVGIRPIVGRTERTLLNMADGYSRAGNARRIGSPVPFGIFHRAFRYRTASAANGASNCREPPDDAPWPLPAAAPFVGSNHS